MANNLILTGIPRSGTSLVCSLLNKLDNTLALVEPLDVPSFLMCTNGSARRQFLNNYFEHTRDTLLATGQVRCLDFAVEGNTFASHTNGLRENIIKGYKEESVARNMSADFKLVVKHPNIFTALLEELAGFFPCFAVVRNPVSVIASWSTLAHPLSEGHAPMAEAFDMKLSAQLNGLADKLSRQIYLVNWYFDIYSRLLNPADVIRYEDVIASQGACLVNIAPQAKCLNQSLHSRNTSEIYNKELMVSIADKLLGMGGAWRDFYSDRDIYGLA